MRMSDWSTTESLTGSGTLTTLPTVVLDSDALKQNDEIFTLGPYLLVGLIAVGLLLLVAVPALYYMAARKPVSPLGSCYLEGPRKAVDGPAIGLNAVVVLPKAEPKIETVLPQITNQELRYVNDEMRKIRNDALQVARAPVDFDEPMTKIEKVDLNKYYIRQKEEGEDYGWLIGGVNKCEKWNIEMDYDKLSITSRRSIEDTLDAKRFDLPAWKKKLTIKDLRKTKLARPPSVPYNLPPCPTDDNVVRETKLNAELDYHEERQKILDKQRKKAAKQKMAAELKAMTKKIKAAENKAAEKLINGPETKTPQIRSFPVINQQGAAAVDQLETIVPDIISFPNRWQLKQMAEKSPVSKQQDNKPLQTKQCVENGKEKSDVRQNENHIVNSQGDRVRVEGAPGADKNKHITATDDGPINIIV